MNITKSMKAVISKAALASVVLGGFLIFSGATSAQAHDWDNYRRPVVRYDDYRLHRAIERDGFYSHQADYWRHERHEAFEHGFRDRYGCWHRY